MGSLDNKVAVITGAGRGIGRSHALLFAREGAAVVVNDLGGGNDGNGSPVQIGEPIETDGPWEIEDIHKRRDSSRSCCCTDSGTRPIRGARSFTSCTAADAQLDTTEVVNGHARQLARTSTHTKEIS